MVMQYHQGVFQYRTLGGFHPELSGELNGGELNSYHAWYEYSHYCSCLSTAELFCLNIVGRGDDF